MKDFILLTTALLWSTMALSNTDEVGVFVGRVSRVNPKAKMVRIRTDYKNKKYLNKLDRVELFNFYNQTKRCKGYVIGKTNEYFLFKINELAVCAGAVNLTTGGVVHVFSEDLKYNLIKGKDVVDILLKKKMAMGLKKDQRQKDLDNYIEKVSAVNERYRSLREKLEMEWQKEVSDLEEDKAVSLREFKYLEIELRNINEKLEKYKVHEQQDRDDRWALDKEIYRNRYE